MKNTLTTLLVLVTSINYLFCSIEKLKDIKSLETIFDKKEILLEEKNFIIADRSHTVREDKKGNLYFIDWEQVIYKYDKNGKFINKLHKIGRGPGEYTRVNGLCVDNNENIYIEDLEKDEILKYDNNFKFIKSIKLKSFNPYSGMAIIDNSIYLINAFTQGSKFIEQYDLDGKFIKSFNEPDDLGLKYNRGINRGYISQYENKLIYTRANYNEINIYDPKNNKTEVIKIKTNFIQIKTKQTIKDKTKYNVIKNFFVFRNFFLVTYNSIDSKYSSISLIDRKGNSIKNKLRYGKLIEFIQINNNTLASLQFEKIDGKIKPMIVKLTLKKEYQ